ncbi:uncharacterized protein LOC125648693 isoform X2 [Ostrea edulis]|uniref:uncharacterized protein LOC125648693 isoform X2 n=1 Tax=Ostrea edulis TaxID=37623 RepID=UPI0024AF7CF3|nr:uncharacterized protein LOC125648693 isoform X2 [Ostrea edulis]
MENEKHSRRYRIGREGNTDLKYTDSENNPSCTYYRDHLPALTNETVKVGMRVITDAPINDNGMLGTIVNIKTQKSGARKNTENMAYSEIDVQFDNGFTESFQEPRDLKLYDNGQTGTVHGAYCDTCNDQTLITGLRWKCTQCSDFDLCTECYMNDEDDVNHIYQRIVQEGASETLQTTRKEVIESRKTLSGIFVGTEVTALDDVHSKGKVKRFCNYNIDVQRNAVNVMWSENEAREEIIDLICTSNEDSDISYYPEHLPDLGNDSRGYVKVKDGNAEATVILWFTKEPSSRRISEKPKLYITFADNSNIYKSDNTIRGHIREIKKFSRKNKLPCHSVCLKLLFVEDRVFIHHKTDPAVIKLLISLGISIIHRGDANDDEDEMLYFKRMAEYSCEDLLLPVIISMGNGKSSREVLQYASENKIPIVYFKKDTEKGHDAFVLTPDEEFLDSCKATEHRFDLKTPWKRQKVERRVIGTNGDGKEEENEISSLNEITLQQNFSFDAHICYLLIGVSMESDTYGKIFGCLSNVYPNALSMYLLKEGKWKIPKDVIKKSFSHKSLEYIAEESMTEKFEGGLWKELQEMSGHAYKPPAWVKIKKSDCVSDDFDDSDEDSTDASATKDTQEHKLDVTISDLYGLIFYALLIRKFYNGARQLLETGCVRIRHILVGCVILQKEENKWQTSQLEKEQLQQMHKIFSHHALRIISCIHDADNRSTTKKSRDDGRFRELLLGDPVLHSGRLLLNHGYLKDAIKTENKTFLDNEVVKDILNEKWYGKTKLTLRRKMEFLCFSLLHFALLPVLMFTMESFPFQRIYKIYNIPFMKVLNNLVGLFSLLLGYAYMLLFNHEENISYADIFLMVWIGSFLIDETKQVIIAVWRGKFRMYVQDPWNTLDWLSIITFTCGMLLKTGSGLNYFNASKIFLVLAFILLSIRVLHLFCISELLGPKLVIIQKMFIDTFAFMAVMTVITMCYNVSYYAILYHGNSDFSFDTLEKVTRNGYWMLFGELNLEGDRVTEPDCSFDEAMYSNGTLERCPSSLGRFLAPYLKALYVLVAVILMLNLLIAMYSYTFSEVHVKSKFYWSQLQTDFLEEYSLKSLFPFHMQWLAMPFCFIHFLIWKTRTGCITFCKRDKNRDDSTISDSTSYGGYKEEADVKLNNSPMFVRVFLYDTNFDLKLKKTRELEGHAAMKAKRLLPKENGC